MNCFFNSTGSLSYVHFPVFFTGKKMALPVTILGVMKWNITLGSGLENIWRGSKILYQMEGKRSPLLTLGCKQKRIFYTLTKVTTALFFLLPLIIFLIPINLDPDTRLLPAVVH